MTSLTICVANILIIYSVSLGQGQRVPKSFNGKCKCAFAKHAFTKSLLIVHGNTNQNVSLRTCDKHDAAKSLGGSSR